MSVCNFKPIRNDRTGIYHRCRTCGCSADEVMEAGDESCKRIAAPLSTAPDVKAVIQRDVVQAQAEKFDRDAQATDQTEPEQGELLNHDGDDD